MTDQEFMDAGSGLADAVSTREGPIPTMVMDDLWSPPEMVDGEATVPGTQQGGSDVPEVEGGGDAQDVQVTEAGADEDEVESDVMLTPDVPETEAPSTLATSDADVGHMDASAISPRFW